jgi:hypothetical protein
MTRSSLLTAILTLLATGAEQANAGLTYRLDFSASGFHDHNANVALANGTASGLILATDHNSNNIIEFNELDSWEFSTTGFDEVGFNYTISSTGPNAYVLPSIQLSLSDGKPVSGSPYFSNDLPSNQPGYPEVTLRPEGSQYGFQIVYRTTGDHQVAYTENYSVNVSNLAAVPEPSTFVLGLVGVAVSGGVWWRRRRSAA